MKELDLFMVRLAANLRESCGTFFTPLFKAITLSGTIGAVFIAATIVLMIFKKTRKCAFLTGIALLCGLLFTNILLKNLIARPRPYSDVSSEYFALWVKAGSLKESGFSFPSGHATAATAFSVSAFLFFNKKYSWLFLLIPLIMGFTRIYFVVHYATDVLGGFLSGTAAAICSSFIVGWIEKFEWFKKITT